MTEETNTTIPQQNLKSVLESVLFVSEKPLALDALTVILSEYPKDDVVQALESLRTDYESEERGIYLAEVSNAYQFRTKASNSPWLFKLNKAKPVRLSKSTLETLSIIAYRQPVTRPEIDEIRGVDSGHILRTLLERNLIKILGKREEPGNPLIYGTTNDFLSFFGLKNLSDLPTLQEYTELAEESLSKLEKMLPSAPENGGAQIEVLETEPLETENAFVEQSSAE